MGNKLRVNRVVTIKEYSQGYGKFIYKVKISENDGLGSATTFEADGLEDLIKGLREELENG